MAPTNILTHRMDHTLSGKVRGCGIYFQINTLRCSNVAVLVSSCSLDQEYLTARCHHTPCLRNSHWQQLHLTDVNVKFALDKLYTVTKSLETEYSETSFIIARDYNQANPTSVLPKYCRVSMSHSNTFDHHDTMTNDAHCSVSSPQFGESDLQMLCSFTQLTSRNSSTRVQDRKSYNAGVRK